MITRRQLLGWLSLTPFASFVAPRKTESLKPKAIRFEYQRLYQIEDTDRQTGEVYLNSYCTQAYAQAHLEWLNNNIFHCDHRIIETDFEGIILYRTKEYNEVLHVREMDAHQYLEDYAASMHPSCQDMADKIRANKQAHTVPVLIHTSIRKIQG